MEYNVADIVREIRVTLDQNMTSDALEGLGDVDTLSLEEIIQSKIIDAVRQVIMSAPVWLLGPGIPFGDSIAWDTQEGIGSGYVLLPVDFLRLVAFQMTDWSQPVYDAITPADPRYAMQHSRFPGIRGCPEKPVVALINKPTGMALEFFSCNGGAGTAIMQANYMPQPSIVEGKISIPYQVKDAAVYYAAYLVALTEQQGELAEKMLAVSNSFIQQ